MRNSRHPFQRISPCRKPPDRLCPETSCASSRTPPPTPPRPFGEGSHDGQKEVTPGFIRGVGRDVKVPPIRFNGLAMRIGNGRFPVLGLVRPDKFFTDTRRRPPLLRSLKTELIIKPDWPKYYHYRPFFVFFQNVLRASFPPRHSVF